MNKMLGLLCVAVAALLPPSVGMSQQAVRWEPTLESAQRLAGQTNRLVLIYFCGPSCVYCKRMEAEVLSQPSVAAAINADYVAVKIVADQFPATARRYAITHLPTTVIASPQGPTLDRREGFVPASEYAARLGQVAFDMKRRREAVYAQMPAGGPPPAMNQPAMNQPVGVQTPPAGQPPFGPAVTATAPSGAAVPSGISPPYGGSPRPIASPPTVVQQSPPPLVAQQPIGPPQNNVAPPAPAGTERHAVT